MRRRLVGEIDEGVFLLLLLTRKMGRDFRDSLKWRERNGNRGGKAMQDS